MVSREVAAAAKLLNYILVVLASTIVFILKGILEIIQDLIWAIMEPILLRNEPRIDMLYVRYKNKMDAAKLMRRTRRNDPLAREACVSLSLLLHFIEKVHQLS